MAACARGWSERASRGRSCRPCWGSWRAGPRTSVRCRRWCRRCSPPSRCCIPLSCRRRWRWWCWPRAPGGRGGSAPAGPSARCCWRPADRIVDGAWIALVVAGGVGAARLTRRLDAMPIMQRLGVSPRSPAFGLGAAALFALLSLGSDTLMLRPGAGVWPSLSSIERGLRLPDFWSLLGRLPEGRLLFVRSGVPLVYGGNWWRPHPHVTALTPVRGGRAIVHGTFTHPSPIAALRHRGGAAPAALTPPPEQPTGRTLFGERLEALDPARFAALADRLGVAVVVALEDDVTQLGWLAESTAFRRRLSLAPFVVFTRESAVALPTPRDGVWRTTLAGEAGGWTCARVDRKSTRLNSSHPVISYAV